MPAPTHVAGPSDTPPGEDPPFKLIGRVHRAFMRLADHHLRDQGFATGQLPVLLTLKHGPPRSQAELARIARVEQPSMAQLLNRMERDGLVQRVPDPDDKRSRLIMLTPDCAQRMPKARQAMLRLADEALTEFSPEELALLTGLMHRLVGKVEAMVEERLGD